MFKKLPNLKHLKIFGCDAYPLKLNEKGDKFRATAKGKCLMIGYGDKEGIYWILEKETRKTFRSRDVRFNENRMVSEKVHESSILIDTTKKIIVEANLNLTDNEESDEKDEESSENNDSLAQNTLVKSQDSIDKLKDSNNSLNSGNTSCEELLKKIRTSSRPKKQTEFYQAGESETQKKNVHFSLVSCESLNEYDEPNSIKEALKSTHKEKWKEAINSELDSLKENNTWVVSNLPPGKKAIKTRWIYKIKKNSNNEPERFKARLVAKGYNQEHVIDYEETFAPVVKQQSIRLMLAIATNEKLIVHQIDIFCMVN